MGKAGNIPNSFISGFGGKRKCTPSYPKDGKRTRHRCRMWTIKAEDAQVIKLHRHYTDLVNTKLIYDSENKKNCAQK